MRITLPYDFGETVYLKIKPEKVKGLVTGYHICHNCIMVTVTWADTYQEMSHYIFELTKEYTLDYDG